MGQLATARIKLKKLTDPVFGVVVTMRIFAVVNCQVFPSFLCIITAVNCENKLHYRALKTTQFQSFQPHCFFLYWSQKYDDKIYRKYMC
jgi:hypothetical protein